MMVLMIFYLGVNLEVSRDICFKVERVNIEDIVVVWVKFINNRNEIKYKLEGKVD